MVVKKRILVLVAGSEIWPRRFTEDQILSDLNFSIGSDMVYVGFLSAGFRRRLHRNSSEFDEIRAEILPMGSRQKPYRIRTVFSERCRIPSKSAADSTRLDRIHWSDWISLGMRPRVDVGLDLKRFSCTVTENRQSTNIWMAMAIKHQWKYFKETLYW